jgi:hypothetical protein
MKRKGDSRFSGGVAAGQTTGGAGPSSLQARRSGTRRSSSYAAILGDPRIVSRFPGHGHGFLCRLTSRIPTCTRNNAIFLLMTLCRSETIPVPDDMKLAVGWTLKSTMEPTLRNSSGMVRSPV